MIWSDFHPLIQDALVTTASVSVLVLLVLLIRKPFATRFGANAAYMLWLLPLARFVTPPLPSNWALSGWLGFGRNTETVTATPILNEPGLVLAAPSPEPAAVQPVTDSLATLSAAAPSLIETTSTTLSSALMAQLPLILLLTWIAGVALWLTKSIRQQHTFLQLIRDDSEPASPAVLEMTQQITRQLGIKRMPAVRTSLLCSGPLVTGLKNPVILLPMWFEEDYRPAEQRDALIHELMHLKRRDLWAFQIARIIAATQWFNPLVYIGLQAFRTDQEAACDADVIRRAKLSPAEYGRTLVKAARLARPSDRRIAAASLTLAHPIKERLIMMTNPTPSLRARLLGGSLALTLGAGAVFATASAVSTAQELDGAPSETSAEMEATHAMSFSFNIDGETFEFDMTDLPPMPPLPELPPIPGVQFDIKGDQFSMHFDTDEFEMGTADMAEFETQMEAWGEKMEAWGEQVELRAERWAETAEPQIEAWAEKHAERIEHDVEKWAEQVEAMADHAARRAEMAAKHSDKYGQSYDGVTSAETRDFGNAKFDQIEVGSGLKVVYTQDPQASVTAELRRGKWADVDIKVVGDTLKISRKKNSGWNQKRLELTVYASSKSLEGIDVASGSAFEGNLVAQNLKVDASSGSSLRLAGACNTIDVDASSGSNVQFGDFECKRAKVDASSGSNIQVFASNSVDVDASSGSNIRVRGNPSDVKKDASSGASVRIG